MQGGRTPTSGGGKRNLKLNVIMDISSETQQLLNRRRKAVGGFPKVLADALATATAIGAENVRMQLVNGELGLKMQNPGSGLAASVDGWMIDRNAPLGAVGIPANSPAIGYAKIQNDGGTITPKRAKNLAIPISDEAKKHDSPRDMDGLVCISRKDKPPLLIKEKTGGRFKDRMELHWVLVKRVTIPATHWLTDGVQNASGEMCEGFGSTVNEDFTKGW